MTGDQTLAMAKGRHLAGDLRAARDLYQRVRAMRPDDADILLCLGVLELQCGAYDAALAWLDEAIAHAPEVARLHFARGQVLAAAQRFTDALCAYERVLALDAPTADLLFAMGTALQALNDRRRAIDVYTRAIELEPAHVDALNNLGNCYRQQHAFDDAQAAYRRALALQPHDANALTNLGTLLQARGQIDDAIALLEAAVRAAPASPYALLNLGVALFEQRDFATAVSLLTRVLELDGNFPEAAYNLGNALHALGKTCDACSRYQQAIARDPSHADAYNNLGNVRKELGDAAGAADAFDKAIELRPDFVAAHNNAATLMRTLGRIDEAERRLRRALEIDPHDSVTHNNLGTVLKDAGRVDDGIACYRDALRCDPQNVVAHSNLAYALTFSAEDSEALLDECRRWAARHEARYRAARLPHRRCEHDADRTRRLRIGYVSPDFRHHCQALFMMPLLSHHDHARFEIHCYSSVARSDDITARIASHADVWRDVRMLDDAQLAQQIHDDQIDILLDLTMHMADARPLLFARKPAPVQIAWLAYPGTTGIDAIDYRLTDPWLDPPGAERHYSERSIRLADSFWCYDPLTGTPAVNALPAFEKGHLTFGCLNNPCKLTDRTLQLWCGVLHEVHTARLLLMAPPGAARARLTARLASHGIGSERVRFVPFQSRAGYLRTYHEIDIGLDTFPYNGHTTSLDACWMGVPVVTRVGASAVGRAGLSQSMNLGLSELAAHSDAQFVDIALRLARDWPRIARLRDGLRARITASPLMDGARFAAQVEAAYRSAWERWCDDDGLSRDAKSRR
ncbi:tetratricopeptide repeat protein [Paraburkholderia humisilvae]|uniref:protein O-GlcNAc transferase n=1 Tax=Paraburkholderia humisilvae TaxID=627669 RepID=A0A6J5CWG2_9BURK|nr:tetratricopeptide repeat protein [Paraburkholderia humisilvae]CAB3746298.1 Photosystem I assembly protein Ycf3 [Paraburkholderia humisilvae]